MVTVLIFIRSFFLHTMLIGDIKINANKVLIGNVYQIVERKVKSLNINYSDNRIKEHVLLFI